MIKAHQTGDEIQRLSDSERLPGPLLYKENTRNLADALNWERFRQLVEKIQGIATRVDLTGGNCHNLAVFAVLGGFVSGDDVTTVYAFAAA